MTSSTSFTNMPTLVPIIQPTPMRIVQNLRPEPEPQPDPESETTSFEFSTLPRGGHMTVEPWIEEVQVTSDPSDSMDYQTSGHPTLIYEPRGETIPTIRPMVETTTTPNIVDHVFASLMNTQHRKLVELTQQQPMTTTDQPSFSLSIEQQPIPPDFTSGSAMKSLENEFGMKVEPYQPIKGSGESEVTTTTSSTTTTSTSPTTNFEFIFPTLPDPEPESTVEDLTDQKDQLTTTSTTPIPILFFNFTQPPPMFRSTPPNDSPCLRQIYGDATIMCETQPQICPIGTYCQIGNGQSICCPILEDPPCEQALEAGIGTSPVRRWYFDPATRLCQPFQFNGFKGNQNNFVNYEECSRACGSTNICQLGSPIMSHHTHLLSCSSSADCQSGYTCVQSTPHNLCCQDMPPKIINTLPSNLVVDFIDPSSSNPCDQMIDVGYGGMAEHRWAFSNGHCVSFIFSGLGGNMNNFLTRTDCVKICQKGSESNTAIEPIGNNRCSQPAASGHGDQYLSRYFYSPEYRQCLHFIYSGAGGNENLFETLTDCLETCVANGVKFSSLGKIAGPPPPMSTTQRTFTFSFHPRNVCPQGDPLVTAVDGSPIPCDPTARSGRCPGDHVCTPSASQGTAYCCPSPMNYCLQSRPALSVCTGPDYEPVREIRFTYDPLADRCVRFNFQNCRGSPFGVTSTSLNNFVSNSQCNRLCCNQGYNLVYKRRLLKAMNDDPMED